ncbi:putative signal peptide protein [Puccinia sorghi]|uniref:Putative signal peptide protein n=1 Tax=Puccinia sorghi TaxID=27349 RepID=A0A0L6UYM6_9BASI|nr:putative signal peptide protein [Puccinia sorghi]
MRLCKFAATLSMLLHASLVISLPQGMTPVPLIQPGRVDLLQQLQLVKQAAMGGDPTVVYALVVGLFQSELRVSAGESMTSDTSTTSYYVAMMRLHLLRGI